MGDRQSIRHKRVLITAGPTREHWDPVRFLSNASSGRMGIALAQEASRLGAHVTVVLGPTAAGESGGKKNWRVIPVVSALEMEKKVLDELAGTDIFVGAAAVADYRPRIIARQKIKEKPPKVNLLLVRNPDIIAKVARPGRRRPSVVIGFALETEKMAVHAASKLRRKNLDWIVANRETNVGKPGGSATLLSRGGTSIRLGRMSKEKLARQIWKAVLGPRS